MAGFITARSRPYTATSSADRTIGAGAYPEPVDDDADEPGEQVPPPNTSIVLIRHGESLGNSTGAIAGHRTCGGLSETGHTHCRLLADRLARTKELDGAVLISSPFRRAIETAGYLAAVLGVAPTSDAAFGEIDPGEECDGLLYRDFVARYGEPDFARLADDPTISMLPGGEAPADFQRRVICTLDTVVAAHPARTVVIATHGGVIDVIVRHVTGAPLRGRFALWSTNASITQLTLTPTRWHVGREPERWRLDRYNDAAHLNP